MSFTAEQINALIAPLDRSHVKSRSQAGRSLSYVEGWHAIAEANRIFGFDAWASETVDIRCVSERERKVGKPPYDKDGWGVSYVARVRVTVDGVVREGVGAGHGIDVDLGLAHESAIKESETDARKRALMTFGNPFGLALYDKEQRNVADEPAPERATPPAVTDLSAITAYIIKAKTDVLGCESVQDVIDWWKGEAPKRAALHIAKGTNAYQQLADIGSERQNAITEAATAPLRAG